MRSISVLGCGYLGVTHAACMAELGHQVVGVDADSHKTAQLVAGKAPFFEPGLQELVNRHLRTGRLHFATSYAEGAAQADVHFICAGTPQPEGGSADLSFSDSVIDELAPRLEECLVVGKSMVPVGTAAHVADQLAVEAPCGEAVLTAWNRSSCGRGMA